MSIIDLNNKSEIRNLKSEIINLHSHHSHFTASVIVKPAAFLAG